MRGQNADEPEAVWCQVGVKTSSPLCQQFGSHFVSGPGAIAQHCFNAACDLIFFLLLQQECSTGCWQQFTIHFVNGAEC